MNKLQLSIIFSAIVILMVMYFGCDTKPKDHQKIEQQRAVNAESTDLRSLVKNAKSKLTSQNASVIVALETQLVDATTKTAKIELLKKLSGEWFSLKHWGIAGAYAQKVAEESETEDAWSIAGTSYTLCVQKTEEKKVKDFCADNAVRSFENAISLNPENTQHRVNLALLYTEKPPEENPMKGILMLLELNKQYPEDVSVLNNLGRLGMQTNQFEKAVKRLEKANLLDPQNGKTICLLADAYQGLGNPVKAEEFQVKCRALMN